MIEKKHFVYTTDPETAEKLRREGLVELKKDGSRFVFANDWSKQNFSEDSGIDKSKIVLSNRINI